MISAGQTANPAITAMANNLGEMNSMTKTMAWTNLGSAALNTIGSIWSGINNAAGQNAITGAQEYSNKVQTDIDVSKINTQNIIAAEMPGIATAKAESSAKLALAVANRDIWQTRLSEQRKTEDYQKTLVPAKKDQTNLGRQFAQMRRQWDYGNPVRS